MTELESEVEYGSDSQPEMVTRKKPVACEQLPMAPGIENATLTKEMVVSRYHCADSPSFPETVALREWAGMVQDVRNQVMGREDPETGWESRSVTSCNASGAFRNGKISG